MKKLRRIKARIAFILFALSLIFVALAVRVYYLKHTYGAEYETAAKQQQVSRYDEIISPNRGSIVDRNNHPLALSTTVYNIVMDVRVLAEHDEEEQVKTCRALADAFDLDYNTLKGYTVKGADGKPALDTSWKVLAKQQTKDVKEALENQGLKGVVYQKDTKRKYPEGVMASQVVGFVRDAMWGIEKEYNSQMSGVPGRSFITYNGSEGAIGQEIAAEDGNTIVTTLDYQIQQFAQEAADMAMADFNAEYTAAMVMNPNTGEIIAMAQTPTFDLNNPTTPIDIAMEEWELLDEDAQYEYLNKTWKNFCVSDTFEPGSVFKPIVVSKALEQGIIRSDETFFCSGVKTVAGIPIRCHLRSGHGIQSVEDIIANSCNVGMMEIAERMGASMMYQCQIDYGVGSLTGIDLPAETDAASLMYDEDEIRSTELATMSFGQSFNTTIIQSATALSAVINGGNIVRPYVVSQIIDENGAVISETKPEVVRKVISKEVSDTVREFMVSTVEYGTGKKAKIDGYSFGAKTGTAQQGDRSKGIHTVSYASFFPTDNPQYLVMAVIHKPEQYIDGVTSAAPMMKGLLEKIFKYKNIEPDNLEELANGGETLSVTVPDFKDNSLEDVLYDLEVLNLQYEVVGSGNKVVNQMPHGSAVVKEGSKVLIYVEKGEDETGTIVVPDVKGKTYDEAVKILTERGLGAVIYGDETGIAAGTEPKYGLTVEKGTEVTIYFEAAAEELTEESVQE